VTVKFVIANGSLFGLDTIANSYRPGLRVDDLNVDVSVPVAVAIPCPRSIGRVLVLTDSLFASYRRWRENECGCRERHQGHGKRERRYGTQDAGGGEAPAVRAGWQSGHG